MCQYATQYHCGCGCGKPFVVPCEEVTSPEICDWAPGVKIEILTHHPTLMCDVCQHIRDTDGSAIQIDQLRNLNLSSLRVFEFPEDKELRELAKIKKTLRKQAMARLAGEQGGADFEKGGLTPALEPKAVTSPTAKEKKGKRVRFAENEHVLGHAKRLSGAEYKLPPGPKRPSEVSER